MISKVLSMYWDIIKIMLVGGSLVLLGVPAWVVGVLGIVYFAVEIDKEYP